MPVDLSIFGKQKTLLDQQAEQNQLALLQQAFALKKQAALRGGDLPAPLQLANEYQKRIQAGDLDGANLIMQFAKTNDKGLQVNADGTYGVLPGYAPAVSGIEGAKAGAKQQAEKNVDLVMNPQIASGTQDAQNASDLVYKPKITAQNKVAENNASQVLETQKKASAANTMSSLTGEARALLQSGNPTGSYLGAAKAAGKGVLGMSDANTQANSKLEIIAANLTGAVPRMEGPQSDADRAYYQEQAGRVGDRTRPIGDRLAALDAIDKLNSKYAPVSTPAKEMLGNFDRGTLEAEARKRGLIK